MRLRGIPAAADRARPSQPSDDRLVVAQVLAAHGVEGELKCRIVTDFPQRFRRGVRVLVADKPDPTTIVAARVSGPTVFLRLAGIHTREEAAALRGAEIQVASVDAVKLPEGQFFWSQVIGLRVEDLEGNFLGTVAEILQTGSSDVYIVDTPGGELLLPATREVLREIVPSEGRMTVQVLPGMVPTPRKPPRSPGRKKAPSG